MDSPVRVLIVDDDFGTLQTLKYIFMEKGYEAETAKDGFKAIERVKERAFDIILMDIKMPGMNGVDVLKEINRLSPGTTTVMMSAYPMDEVVQKAKRDRGAGRVQRKGPQEPRFYPRGIQRTQNTRL